MNEETEGLDWPVIAATLAALAGGGALGAKKLGEYSKRALPDALSTGRDATLRKTLKQLDYDANGFSRRLKGEGGSSKTRAGSSGKREKTPTQKVFSKTNINIVPSKLIGGGLGALAGGGLGYGSAKGVEALIDRFSNPLDEE